MLPAWLLFLLFVAPLIIALIIYVNWNNIYFSKNKGVSVIPPFNLQFQASFDMKDKLIKMDDQQKHWNIVYLAPRVCTKSCKQRKTNLAKMHQKLGNKQTNVALFSTQSSLTKIYNNSKYQALILKENNLLITDPNNKVVMYYESNAAINRILADVKKLLASTEQSKS
jgi:peroxiredoxin